MKEQDLSELRHSAAHLLAAAVKDLWPNAKPTIGPPVTDGFYYDFDFNKVKISEEDLPKIEKKMKEVLSSWKGFERFELSPAAAKNEFKDNPYKLELIAELVKNKEKISIYQSGEFRDLCRGGHTPNPKKDLQNFKLTSIAGAYWRGDEKNPMLTRIYGTIFPTKADLEEHLARLELAKARDHRKLGKELDLFTFSDLVGAGLPLYTPKGALLRSLIFRYVEEIQARHGYQQVWTPQINKAELFKTSGHYDKYRENMFRVSSNYSEEEFFLKPMNCPQHTQIYASRSRSYRDLPLRFTDFAMLYRDEKPGELLGLARTRAFSQDDCHIFCREDQVDAEIDTALAMTKEIMATYGFKYRYRLSTRDPDHPEKYLGDPRIWDKVESWAEKIMKRNKIEHFTAPGEAAFYAPKMDLLATDSLGREWQLSTIQIDFVMPQRFGLSYTDQSGKESIPVMIHRAIVGSAERFLMVVIEHFGGEFPVWLSPVQVKIIPVSEKFERYAQGVQQALEDQVVRVELDDRNEKMQAKIRDAQLEKIPYMLVVGEKEEKSQTVAVRLRSGEDRGARKLSEVVDRIADRSASRRLDLW